MITKQSISRHSTLQSRITRDFVANFAPEINILYLEDGAEQTMVFDRETFANIGVPLEDFNGLPDTILLDRQRNWLFMIQAVTIGVPRPLTTGRRLALEESFATCKARRVYISAFLNFATYRRFVAEIGWGTEVWIATAPTHMIHYNGGKFLDSR